MNELRDKKIAVYLFLTFTVAYLAVMITVFFVQGAQNGAGSGFNDTKIVNVDDAKTFFKDDHIPRNNR